MLTRRNFFQLASGLLVPAEPLRAYSFAGGWGTALGSVFVNGVWRAWVNPSLRPDRHVLFNTKQVITHDVGPAFGFMYQAHHLHRDGPADLMCLWNARPFALGAPPAFVSFSEFVEQ